MNVTKFAVSCRLVTFTEEIRNGKVLFLRSDCLELRSITSERLIRETLL